ncbi:MAG TPA: hypothetical protein VFZ66_09975 [Herpetosiphonaceae bacterium]
MRRLTFALAGAALALLGLQFSATANITPAPQQRLQHSPLAAYPGFGHNPEADEARFDRESLARERMTAQCMKQKGFPYTEVVPVRNAVPAPDPNVSYAESLSPERRTQYYMALYGVANPNSTNAEELYDRSGPGGGGCQGAAFARIPGVFAAQSSLNEQYLALRMSIRREQRVVEAERRWSACMSARGHQYATTVDLRAALDNAAAEGRLTPQLEQEHRRALEVGRVCGAQSGLDDTIAQVRVEKEMAFVKQHQALLDQHLERVRSEDALLDQILGERN